MHIKIFIRNYPLKCSINVFRLSRRLETPIPLHKPVHQCFTNKPRTNGIRCILRNKTLPFGFKIVHDRCCYWVNGTKI